MVRKLSYDPSSESLRAEVAGNYGDYDVEVTLDGKRDRCILLLSYDGYPCKHIVATLLAYLHDSEKYAHKQRMRRCKRIRRSSRNLQNSPRMNWSQSSLRAPRSIPIFKESSWCAFRQTTEHIERHPEASLACFSFNPVAILLDIKDSGNLGRHPRIRRQRIR